MLIECGHVRAQTVAGAEYSFTPAIGRIAQLGTPREIVELYAELHSQKAETAAMFILYTLCDQSDPSELLGWVDDVFHSGEMPPGEQIILARHLMRHGIIGTAKQDRKGDGKFSQEFKASEYIGAAMIHLGMSRQEAEGLSMTEFQQLFEIKFPDSNKHKDIATREEYMAAMKHFEDMRRG